MNKLLSLITLALTAVTASAQDFTYDGMNFTVLDNVAKTCEIRGNEPSILKTNASGKLVIPDKVLDGNTSYTVTAIGDMAFSYATEITSLTIPNTVLTIGKESFANCTNLETINFGRYVAEVGKNAFTNCVNLKTLDICDVCNWARIKFANTEANPIAYSKTFSVKGVTVKNLDMNLLCCNVLPYTFYNAENIESMRVYTSSLGESSFEGCINLKNIFIDINEIKANAFADCDNIENIYLARPVPPVAQENSFSVYEGVNLYVPYEYIESYINADMYWNRFSNISGSEFKDLDSIFAANYDNESCGVNSVSTAEQDNVNSIYNLQGRCLKRNATQDDIKDLTPGLYIIGNKKLLVK